MNLYECQDFFVKLYKDKKVEFNFDHNCLGQIEVPHTEGAPNLYIHCEYRKVKVSVEGGEDIYVPIAPHRLNMSLKDCRKYFQENNSFHIGPEVKNYLDASTAEDKEAILDRICELSGCDKNGLKEVAEKWVKNEG